MSLYPHLNFPGYKLIEKIYCSARTVVYRGTQLVDGQPVVIKLLQVESPTFQELLQFRHQYTITRNLNIAGIVSPDRLEPYGNGLALVMLDCGGISLREWRCEGVSDVLQIALQLCEILHQLTQHRIIHKDIKPANILIHPESRQVKLIDFSIASQLPKETVELKNPQQLEGTLAYLAPEQTGRMNRGIDHRTDFYALGVTLYELLAGQLPFQTIEPMELVHCHIAKSCEPIHQINPKVPSILSEIVAKLMAKNAEDRYQSSLGLKHDLQICLDQFSQTGTIEAFPIGQCDRSDRFTIPEKLYGREQEVKKLLEAFDRVSLGTSEMMLIAGWSGVGKTAVVNEVHKPIVKQRGYFIKGKFDQFNRNIPFSAFVQAFRDLIRQLLSEHDTHLQQWKTLIQEALGENAQVIIEVIPELVTILGPQPEATELLGTEAQNRFKRLLQQFIQVFTKPEHPLVMFLDDWQWADSASLGLLQQLIGEANFGHLLVIGAYRDNEVTPAHPFMTTLDAIRDAKVAIHTIRLQPLSQGSMNQLVADTLNCDVLQAQALTELVMHKTQGNPFFANQFLKALYQDELICFDRESGYWYCDLAQVRAMAIADDVVEFMVAQLHKLPSHTQDVLKLAACIGAQFSLDVLATVAQQSQTDVAVSLWKALQEGLILPESEIYKFYIGQQQCSTLPEVSVNYRFLHDRVQQAAYQLIADDQKPAVHLKIGQLLQAKTSEAELESNIFAIVNHLNIGKTLLDQPQQKRNLAQLNLLAGRRAKAAIAYATTVNYLTQGLDLLPGNAWLEDYELTLSMHHERLEAACLNTDFAQVEIWAEEILKSANTILDTIKVHEVRMMSFRSQGQFEQVVAIGLQVLKLLGLEFPASPSMTDIGAMADRTRQLWQNIAPSSLLERPMMQDPHHLAAMQILTKLVPSAHIAAPNLLPLLIFQQVEMSIQFGNSPISVFSYADYGFILCGVMGDIASGYEFGQLSLNLLDRLQINAFKSRGYFVVNSFVRYWQEPLRQSIPWLLKGYNHGLETGDWECVALNSFTYSCYRYWSGESLLDLVEEMPAYRQAIIQVKQEATLKYYECYQQVILNLTGQAKDPACLQGEVFDASQVLPDLVTMNDLAGVFHIALNQTVLAYLFGQPEQAMQFAIKTEQYSQGGVGFFMSTTQVFYDALVYLANYNDSSSEQQIAILERIERHQQKLKTWANYAPMNHQHRWQLIEAERSRVLGQTLTAIEHYDLAIASAEAHGYLQDQALANELAAYFYLDWGKEKIAAAYLQEAYQCYLKWGAKAKIDQLASNYSHLLAPIFQPTVTTFNPLETLATFIAPLQSLPSVNPTNSSSSQQINNILDFAAILTAAQSLSSTIELNQLLRRITQIILQNSGANRCALILPNHEGQWEVPAIADLEQIQLDNAPLEQHQELPTKLIRHVRTTQETIIINHLKTDLPVVRNYLTAYQPQSVLCMPILNQSHLVGILYAENRATANVFTQDRIYILNFLCAQVAISLENARLHQQEQKKSHELEQAVTNLQSAQLQLVQSEKMSALGNLVAGVAHEINNPVGCIIGNVGATQAYINDLLGLIDLYAEKYPEPEIEITDEIENIDLDYLREDLPKLIQAMKDSGKRIKSISHSLRTFSRADTDTKQSFNLHEGIDSTVLILRHRLKASSQRPEISIVTNYGDLPLVNCFPGQLNQVFMNILANAIDMFDEMAQSQSYEELVANPQKITISTQIIDNRVQIQIVDNGKGMPKEIQDRIFDHLFTTKRVGQGTGLGLSIVRQIIEEKHSGQIFVESTIGKGTTFIIQLPIST